MIAKATSLASRTFYSFFLDLVLVWFNTNYSLWNFSNAAKKSTPRPTISTKWDEKLLLEWVYCVLNDKSAEIYRQIIVLIARLKIRKARYLIQEDRMNMSKQLLVT